MKTKRNICRTLTRDRCARCGGKMKPGTARPGFCQGHVIARLPNRAIIREFVYRDNW